MKFLPILVLPFILTLGATSLVSTAMSPNVLENMVSSSTVENASSKPPEGTARRGSGRRQVLASMPIEQTSL